jgi:hypothetical protein
MFRITQDPSSGTIDSYLIKTTRSGSTVLVVCGVRVWRHIQDLWCVCTADSLLTSALNGRLQSGTIPEAAMFQFDFLKMSMVMLETYRGSQYNILL